jgi:hypothetical protein
MQIRRRKGDIRCLGPHEHVIVVHARRSAVEQVLGDCRTDIGQQRQRQHRRRLALLHRDQAQPPVDVRQPQTRDVARAQPRPGRQQQDRPVPATYRRAWIRRAHQRLHALRRQHGHRPDTSGEHCRNCPGKPDAPTGVLDKAAEHPQRRQRSTHATRPVASAEEHHRRRHIRAGQQPHISDAAFRQPGQHLPGDSRI